MIARAIRRAIVKAAAQAQNPVAAFSDSFTRTTATGAGLGTSTSGHTWSHPIGSWNAEGTFGRFTSGSGGLALIVQALTDSFSRVTIQNLASGVSLGVVCRYVDANNYYWADHEAGNGVIRFFKRSGGSNTLLSNTNPQGLNSTFTLEIRAVGNVISVLKNGTQIYSHTDSSPHASGSVGLRGTTTGPIGAFDDYSGGSL